MFSGVSKLTTYFKTNYSQLLRGASAVTKGVRTAVLKSIAADVTNT